MIKKINLFTSETCGKCKVIKLQLNTIKDILDKDNVVVTECQDILEAEKRGYHEAPTIELIDENGNLVNKFNFTEMYQWIQKVKTSC